MSEARLALGIDLGTTHCALASAAIERSDSPLKGGTSVSVLSVPQLVSQGALESLPLLPSFTYMAHDSDGALVVPWDEEQRFAVGEWARVRAAEAPGRVISSAKSWLSQSHVDRRQAFLPLHAPEDVPKRSPVAVSTGYLQHLREAWRADAGRSGAALDSLDGCDVVLTVPASFDAAARELTHEAAAAAGFEHVTLLEEPQAALYSWIEQCGERWREHLAPGDVIVVVDIGGGTTDFSAIQAREEAGSLILERVAVGDHILLGGDNMDLALAYALRSKLGEPGRKLDAYQMAALTQRCRAAKEQLLSRPELDAVPIAITSRSANLFASALRTELTRDEVERIVVEAFFPDVDADARPQERPRAALSRLGLAYASDAAVTRHLAAFLSRQAGALGEAESTPAASALLKPTRVLFNGGVLKSKAIRDRLLATLNRWLMAIGAPPASVLPGTELDLAVARGAAYYGSVRHGRGLRIRGGTARAYYVGIESPMPAVPGFEPPLEALCVAPFGMEEGSRVELPEQELLVVVGEPVRFRFFGSSERRHDAAGTQLESCDLLSELAPLEVTLPAVGRAVGEVVAVTLRATITEVGTLLLEAVPRDALAVAESWKVELTTRGHNGEQ